MRLTARKTVVAGLLALALLLGSSTAAISPAHADEAAAVYFGYVVPEAGGAMPKRVRAISESGVVCGSSDVAVTASSTAGFYALSVTSGDTKPGCPAAGSRIRFALVYGMIDETIVVGDSVPYAPGTVLATNLVRTAADLPLALP